MIVSQVESNVNPFTADPDKALHLKMLMLVKC